MPTGPGLPPASPAGARSWRVGAVSRLEKPSRSDALQGRPRLGGRERDNRVAEEDGPMQHRLRSRVSLAVSGGLKGRRRVAVPLLISYIRADSATAHRGCRLLCRSLARVLGTAPQSGEQKPRLRHRQHPLCGPPQHCHTRRTDLASTVPRPSHTDRSRSRPRVTPIAPLERA